ncbi:hypothetical protein, partial [Eisenbergiella massiliensis]|uniref:hypothetical protein n=2 Tax=Eisenbergiella TaxID=1432051 RepID=UPI0023F21B2E
WFSYALKEVSYMRVKVIKRYSDVMLGKIKEVGDTFEVSEQRGKHLIHEGVAVMEKEKKEPAK